MPDDELGVRERAALLVLMTEAREVSNPELLKRYGLTVVGGERRRLNDRKLVASRRQGRAFVHELTDLGWRWCADVLLVERPARSRPAESALYAVLGGVRRYLDRSDLGFADFFQPAATSAAVPDAESLIRDAYRRLAKQPSGWVSLTELRPLLDSVPKAVVDAALMRMERTRSVHIIPEANRKVLTRQDQSSAIRIGGEDKHLIAIDQL